MVKFRRAIDVETPNICSAIMIASTILERDFFDEGSKSRRTWFRKLGLE